MPKIKIEGGRKLSGTITVSGAKNSVVALIPAAILCDENIKINNVPNITDVDDLEDIYLLNRIKNYICFFLLKDMLLLDLCSLRLLKLINYLYYNGIEEKSQGQQE